MWFPRYDSRFLCARAALQPRDRTSDQALPITIPGLRPVPISQYQEAQTHAAHERRRKALRLLQYKTGRKGASGRLQPVPADPGGELGFLGSLGFRV